MSTTMKPIQAAIMAVPESPRRTRKLQSTSIGISSSSSSKENLSSSSATAAATAAGRAPSSSSISKSVPIMKRMKRTPSELQLLEDESVADYRDYCMYSRIMNGMNRRNHHRHQHYQQNHASSHKVMYSIMRTRNQPIQERFHSYDEDFLKYALDVTTKPGDMASYVNAANATTTNVISNDDYGFHAILHEEEEEDDDPAATAGLIIREPEDENDKSEEEPSSTHEEGVFMLDL